ncbi:uncharacterized protein KQ657_001635 [Scheffersomyces spartinae]|uniref:Uncharacterized protein n=1 Tax=Scheffersomyces spartinae TaxID=45513 RepID=A0A9P7V7A7_9ASCO|nr:uncharacterized protein KQ657_001635 [Scheffersomyces spartinae]KAG7192540.1 hypothetical protein KQ657_001635 [Scheffersomyces spartinae]
MISIMLSSQTFNQISPFYVEENTASKWGRFDVANYDCNELENLLFNNIHFDYGYNAILVDKRLKIISTDLLQFNIDDINKMQQSHSTPTNILSFDNGSAIFFENAKSWFSHVLDQSSSHEESEETPIDKEYHTTLSF